MSTDDLAASRLTKAGEPLAGELPSAPAWLSIPGAALRQQGVAPPGIRVVLSALINADRVVVTLGPAAGGIEMKIDATCSTPADARILESQLKSATALIRAHAQQDDLARALAGGSFTSTDRRVTGRWPVEQRVLDSLTAGI